MIKRLCKSIKIYLVVKVHMEKFAFSFYVPILLHART